MYNQGLRYVHPAAICHTPASLDQKNAALSTNLVAESMTATKTPTCKSNQPNSQNEPIHLQLSVGGCTQIVILSVRLLILFGATFLCLVHLFDFATRAGRLWTRAGRAWLRHWTFHVSWLCGVLLGCPL